MTEQSQSQAADVLSDAGRNASEYLTKFRASALESAVGAQRLFGDEVAFARNEILDRVQTETRLFGEFLSKLAEAHSVKDYVGMYETCGRHQMDFIQRDCERLFKHVQHSMNAASRLFNIEAQK